MQGIRSVPIFLFLLFLLLLPSHSQAGHGFFIGGGLLTKRVYGHGDWKDKHAFDITAPYFDTIHVRQQNQVLYGYTSGDDPTGYNLSNHYFEGFTAYLGYQFSKWSLTFQYNGFLRRTGVGELSWDSLSIFSGARYRFVYDYQIRVMHHDILLFAERTIGKTNLLISLGAAYSFERTTYLSQWHVYRNNSLPTIKKERNVCWGGGLGILAGLSYQKRFDAQTYIRFSSNYSYGWYTHGASLLVSVGKFLTD